MYKNVELKHLGQVLSSAKCDKCEFECEALTVLDYAREHAKATGHTVTVIRGIGYKVIPKNKDGKTNNTDS